MKQETFESNSIYTTMPRENFGYCDSNNYQITFDDRNYYYNDSTLRNFSDVQLQSTLHHIPSQTPPFRQIQTEPLPCHDTNARPHTLDGFQLMHHESGLQWKNGNHGPYVVEDSLFQMEPIVQPGSIEQKLHRAKLWDVAVMNSVKKGHFKCSHCLETFRTFISFVQHLDQFNLESTRPHKCLFDDCAWKYVGLPRRAELRRHLQTIHGIVPNAEAEEPLGGHFPCTESLPYCTKSFPRKDSLLRHIRLCHENPNSRFNRSLKKKKQIDH